MMQRRTEQDSVLWKEDCIWWAPNLMQQRGKQDSGRRMHTGRRNKMQELLTSV